MNLRPYQKQALLAIRNQRTAGVNRQLCVLPTGSGKTQIAAHLPYVLGLNGKQLLFLVHRDELVWQAARKFKEINPDLKVTVEKAQHHSHPDSDVIVASVQSIGRGGSSRIKKFDPDRCPIMVVDEAHHLPAGSQYINVLRYFRCLSGETDCDNSKVLLGITATPKRHDKIGLEQFFDVIGYQIGMRELMTTGVTVNGKLYPYLADLRGYRIQTETNLSGIDTRMGDFAQDQLDNAINTPARNELVVRKYRELGEGLPALGFTVSIDHSKELASEFEAQGIHAVAVSGATPERQRHDIYELYRRRKIQVLISCGVLSEGADFPAACIGLMCRPTKSELLYRQQVGRITRPYPSPEEYDGWTDWVKPFGMVLDFCDITGHHNLISIGTLFGLRAEFDIKGKSARQSVEDIEAMEAELPGIDLRTAITVDEARKKLRATVERIDLLKAPVIPPEIQRSSKYGWLDIGYGRYQLSLPDRVLLQIAENQIGQYEVFTSHNGVRTLKHVADTLARAVKFADRLIPAEKAIYLETSADWRREPPTRKQVSLLWKLTPGIRAGYRDPNQMHRAFMEKFRAGEMDYSKGSISAQIDSRISKNRRYA